MLFVFKARRIKVLADHMKVYVTHARNGVVAQSEAEFAGASKVCNHLFPTVCMCLRSSRCSLVTAFRLEMEAHGKTSQW